MDGRSRTGDGGRRVVEARDFVVIAPTAAVHGFLIITQNRLVTPTMYINTETHTDIHMREWLCVRELVSACECVR